jgi:hypothetical protein
MRRRTIDMPYFFELLTDKAKKKFTKIALQIKGPDWKPILSGPELENLDEIDKIMRQKPQSKKQIEREDDKKNG